MENFLSLSVPSVSLYLELFARPRVWDSFFCAKDDGPSNASSTPLAIHVHSARCKMFSCCERTVASLSTSRDEYLSRVEWKEA